MYNIPVMNAGRATRYFTLVLLAVFSSAVVAKNEIYHWVDKNGIPHYSQYRPSGDIPGLSTQKLEGATPPGDGRTEDVYNVKAHEKRMVAWRKEREQKRKDALERKRLAAQRQPVRYPVQRRSFSRSYWYPPFYGRPPHKPPVKPQPPVENPRPPSKAFPHGRSRQG